MSLEFTYIGHSILRKKAARIEHIDQPILDLIKQMKEKVAERKGLGLAAPQVGASLALFIACFPEEDEQGRMRPGPPCVFINPTLSEPSNEEWSAEEGCLSVPKVFAHISRPTGITITYQDEHGKTHTERLKGWPARVVMHENDHINGVLFIDRLDSKTKKRLHKEVEHIKKHYRSHNEQVKIWEKI